MIEKFLSANNTKYFFKQFTFPKEFAYLPKAELEGDLNKVKLSLINNAAVTLDLPSRLEVEGQYKISNQVLKNYNNFVEIVSKQSRILVFTDLKNYNARSYHVVFEKSFWRNIMSSNLIDDDPTISYIFRSLFHNIRIEKKNNNDDYNAVISIPPDCEIEEPDGFGDVKQSGDGYNLDNIIITEDIPDEFLHISKNKIKYALEFYMSDRDYRLNKYKIKHDQKLHLAENDTDNNIKSEEVDDYLSSESEGGSYKNKKEQLDEIIDNIEDISKDANITKVVKAKLALDINKLLKKLARKEKLFNKLVNFLEALSNKNVVKTNIDSTFKQLIHSKNKSPSR